MKIITTDEQLRTFVPNVFASVGGEPTFYQKLEPFLLSAETWTAQQLTGSAALDEISLMPPEHIERHLLSVIIVSEAFRQAVPSLDLVLTPNGFGIVSNERSPGIKRAYRSFDRHSRGHARRCHFFRAAISRKAR